MENKYKKEVPKGIEASLIEKIDPIFEPVWKHTINKNGKTVNYFQRFSEMSLTQLQYVADEATKRFNNADSQVQIYQIKLEQIFEEYAERNKKVVFKFSSKISNTRNASLKSFSDEEFLVEFKRRSLINDKFYEFSFKVQAEIHNNKKQTVKI